MRIFIHPQHPTVCASLLFRLISHWNQFTFQAHPVLESNPLFRLIARWTILLVAQARQLLQGVSADDLRATGDLRGKVQQGMADIAAQLDTMMAKTGGRKFRFDEEDV
jgi:hypothetical protein